MTSLSLCHRVTLVSLATLFCFLMAGIVFGYSALKQEILIPSGVYKDVCPPTSDNSTGDGTACNERELKFGFLFSVTVAATNIAALPIGSILDHFGPKIAAITGCLLFSLGTLGMALSWKLQLDLYVAAYTLIGVGGPFMFISALNFSALFPKHGGLVVSVLTAAFDTSSLIFFFFGLLYKESQGQIDIFWLFLCYTLVPILAAIFALVMIPMSPYRRVGEEPESQDLIDNLEDSVSNSGGKDLIRQDRKAFAYVKDLSFVRQLFTPSFILLTTFICLAMLRLNFYIETVSEQLTEIVSRASSDYDKDGTERMRTFFNIMLPIGGLLSVPPSVYLLDYLSFGITFMLINVLLVSFGILSLVPILNLQYVSIMIFVIMRPLIYSAANEFCLHTFGVKTFGKVYGLVMLIAGSVNLFQQLLKFGAKNLYEGYFVINLGMTIGTLLFASAFPFYLLKLERDARKDNQDLSYGDDNDDTKPLLYEKQEESEE